MSRHLLSLFTAKDRENAVTWVKLAPVGTRAILMEPKRSIPQNDRLWLMLGAISKQLLWHGQYYPDTAWKDFFMHYYRGETWMPGEESGMIPVGRSTSELGKGQHSELQTLIEAFCARHNVGLPWDVVA